MYGDRLHIFTTSKQSALMCLKVLEDESVLDSVVRDQCLCLLLVMKLVSEPYTTITIPSSMSLLNIIPESNDENTRSERNSMVNIPYRRSEFTSFEIDIEEIPEGIITTQISQDQMSPAPLPAPEEEVIQVDRFPTTMSIDINNDIQESSFPILNSSHYVDPNPSALRRTVTQPYQMPSDEEESLPPKTQIPSEDLQTSEPRTLLLFRSF